MSKGDIDTNKRSSGGHILVELSCEKCGVRFNRQKRRINTTKRMCQKCIFSENESPYLRIKKRVEGYRRAYEILKEANEFLTSWEPGESQIQHDIWVAQIEAAKKAKEVLKCLV